MKISKELLSKALDKEVSMWDKDEIKDNVLEIGIHLPSGGRLYKELNIYEFGFKLKEWAKNEGYTIISGYDNDYMGEKYNKRVFGYCCQIQDKEFNIKDFYEDNEINTIIKACQYILDKKIKG